MTENKALLERMYEEVFNKGNVDVADELISRESVDHSGEAPDLPDESEIGPERIKAMVKMLKAAFPDGQWTVEDVVEEGDLIGARVKIEGTHLGERFGMAPTGKRVKVYEMLQARVKDGKLTEIWHQVDMLGMRQQLMGFRGGGPPGGGPPGGGPPGGGPPGGFPGGGPPGGFPGGGPPGGRPGGPPGGFPGGGPPGGGPPGGFPGGGPPGGFPGGGPPGGGRPGGGPPGGFPGGGPPGGGPPGGPGFEIPPGFTRAEDEPPERRSPRDDKKAMMHELYEVVFTQGNLPLTDELIDPGMVDHARPIAARNPDLVPKGPTPIKFFVHRFHESFPDQQWRVENVIEEDDRVMARVVMTGTHEGEFEGVAPTGKHVEIAGLVIFKVENGMIVERWGEIDTLGLLGQLGARPGMGAGGPPR